MIRLLPTVLLALALVLPAVASAAPTQQEKMKLCNASATEKKLKGDERKAFMKTCLSAGGEVEEKKLTPQNERMKSCNAEASEKKLKGEERKAFLKTCLKSP
jgi:hypothetical protein